MCSSTTFSSSRRRLQRAKPSGAGESVSAISFASAAPSKMRGRAELGLYLRVNTASNPFSTRWRLVYSILAMLVSSAAAIWLSLQPSPASDTSAFKRMRALVSCCAERLPLLINSSSWARSSPLNRTTYFLTAISFPATNHLHRWLAATEIQKLPSFSMTGATSFESWLEETGIREEVTAAAIKAVIARQLASEMKKKKITKQRMALLMKTSRAQVDRLLDPENGSATIESLQRAAKIVGRELRLQLV